MAPIEPPAREIEQLVERLIEYKVGAYERFDDAREGEMDGFRLNIVLFGMAGSGKSALINTIFECLETGTRPAVTQTTGREGTKILEACDLPNCVTIYDTRGFFDLGRIEEGELFRIIYGIERPGDDLTRDYTSAAKAVEGGVGAYRLKKKPIADQMHVILWVIKANDVRFETGKYQEIIKFVQHQMREQIVTIITVITFDDEVRSMPNAEEQRKKLKEAARDVTGSEPRDVFMIANLIPDKEFDPAYKKEVLKMLERALKCGELSVKMRQAQRESLKRSMSEPRGRAEKSPVENTEPPDYKSLP